MKQKLEALVCIALCLCMVILSGCKKKDNTEVETTTAEYTEQEKTERNFPPCPVDFDECWKKNKEVYAYIEIPGTNISYPIVQSIKDDNYYLRRDWTGKDNYEGCLFTQSHNNVEFTNPVTVIYGHNTSAGNMFSELLKFKDKKFFDENRYFYIYLPYGTLVYEVFSAHTFDSRHIMNSYDFSKPEVLAEFQQTLLDPPVLVKNTKADIDLNANSHIITLSTCAQAKSGCDERYLVNGVLIDYVFTN